MSTSWTFGPNGVYTASWSPGPPSPVLTVTVTASGSLLATFDGDVADQAIAQAAVNALATPASATWQPADQGFLAWNYDGPSAATGSSAPLGTAGVMYVMAIPVRAAISVTNVVAVLNTNGSVLTSGQCFAALYQGAGGALIGQSGDQSTAWGAGATKLVTMALTGGPFTVAPGIVYAALWFNGTTGPSFARSATASQIDNAGLAATASRWGTSGASVTTTAPGTLGTIAAAGNAYWAALS